MIELILLIISLFFFVLEALIIVAWTSIIFRFKDEKNPVYKPRVSIIIPCKGAEKNFKENILSICNQDYKNYEIVFVIDSKSDPAYSVLQKVVGKKKNVKIVISEFIEGSSGKISALIKGIESIKNTEVYVFADSDIKPNRNWLSTLVSHLKDEKIGATTGYRWYFPTDIRSLILSTFNLFCSLSLYFDISNFTWGGSTAIKKNVFDKVDIAEKWKKGFSDDLILTNALRENKLKIKFLPKCIVESPPEGNLRYILKWGVQQLTWVKWYYPSIWFLSIMGAIGLKIATIFGFVLLALGYVLPGLLLISTIFLEIIGGAISHIISRKIMGYPKNKFGSTISYALLFPVIFFVLTYTNFLSIFQKEIKWGGRVYKKPNI